MSGEALITLAFGTSVTSGVENREYTWNALCGLFTKPTVGTKDGSCFIRGPSKGPARNNHNLKEASILVFECDDGVDLTTGERKKGNGPDPDLVHKVLKGINISHFIWTTYSNQTKGNGYKFRVVCQVERPMNPSESKATIASVFQKLHGAGVGAFNAGENNTWSQAWYLPRVPNTDALKVFKFYHHDGGPLAVCLEKTKVKTLKGRGEFESKDLGTLAVQDDEQILKSAVNGNAKASIDIFNKSYGTVEGFSKLLGGHGYEAVGELRWRKPNSSHTPGVNLFVSNTDGTILLSSHHENDPLHKPGGKPMDFFEAFGRLEYQGKHFEEQRKLALKKVRELLAVKLRDQDSMKETKGIGRGEDYRPITELLTPESALDKLAYITNGDCVVHLENDRKPMPLKSARNNYAASIYTESRTTSNGITEKSMPVLDIWLRHPARLTYECTGFHPGQGREVRSPDGLRAVNLWKPIHRFGEVNQSILKAFIEHIRWLFGDRADDFLDWLAHIEQFPGVLPHSAWLHIAIETGLGRNWLAGVLARVWLGYTAPGVNLIQMLKDGFTDDLSQRLLAQVDEIREGGREKWEHSEELKSLLNCEFRTINRKAIPAYREHNFCRWLLFSNHLDAVPLQDNDRRVEVVICNENPKDEGYYIHLYGLTNNPDFINSVGLYLRQRDITGFNPGAKAKKTTARATVLNSLKSDDHKAIEHLVRTWPGDLISNEAFARQLNEETGGFSRGTELTTSQRSIAKRLGVERLPKPVFYGGKLHRFRVLRNAEYWMSEAIDPDEIRKEAAKVGKTI